MTEVMPPQFDVSVDRHPAGAVVRVAGELDIATVPALANAIRGLERPYERVVLELSAVTFIDSTGLTLAVTEQQRARDEGFDLVLAGVTEPVLDTLKLTGFDGTLAIAPDVDAALTRTPTR